MSETKRKKEILGCFEGADSGVVTLVARLAGEMAHLEKQLTYLRGLPWLVVNPNDKADQKQTPASKLYASLISRYTDIVNKLATLLRRNEVEEDSPLRAYLKGLKQPDD